MKPTTAEIAFILDRCGSMTSCLEATISAFNEFLRLQRGLPGQARFTLIQFDDQYEVHAAGVPLAEMVELTTATYEPRGSTALLDAVGRTLDTLEARIQHLDPASRPAAVIVAILTDGLENSSTQYTWRDVSSRIARLRGKAGWQFLFLGADADAIAQASRMNIQASHTSAFHLSEKGLTSASIALHRKAAYARKLAAGALPTLEEARDAATPLGNLVAEEENKPPKK